jgi:hypothetical protein
MTHKSICSELVPSAKSPKSAEFAQKHARSKLSITTVNQPIVRKSRLFSGVDFSRLLLIFCFLFHFCEFDEANCLRLFPVATTMINFLSKFACFLGDLVSGHLLFGELGFRFA